MDLTSYVLGKKYTDNRVTELTGLNYTDINEKLDTMARVPVGEVFTATEGQTIFNLSNSFDIGSNMVAVEIDGVPQFVGEGFTESSTTSVTLSEGVPAGSIVKVTLYKTPVGVDTKIQDVDSKVTNLEPRVTQVESSLADMTTKQGDLTQLNTTDKSSVVNALKEVKTQQNANTTSIANIGNGSPKGVYASLSALQTAYPTGTTGIFVVTADGKWYYWSGSAWTAGGTYQATSIAKKSLTPDKLSYFNFTDNLYNGTNTANTGLDIATGNKVTKANYSVTDYIPISVLPYNVYNNPSNNLAFNYAFYDTNKVFTRYVTNASYNPKMVPQTGEAFVIVEVPTSSMATLYIYQSYDVNDYRDYNSVKYTLGNNIIIPEAQINSNFVSGQKSSNLFDKNNVISGKYINGGSLSSNATWFSSYLIPLDVAKSLVHLNFNASSGRYALHDKNGNYITNSAVTLAVNSVDITYDPATVGFIRISNTTATIGSIMLSYDTSTYQDYGKSFVTASELSSEVLGMMGAVKDYKIVSKAGHGDYTTIADAVNAAVDGDVILVMPGSYEESVYARGKFISIIGLDKSRCILWNSTGDYNTPPLDMTIGFLKNMTIKTVRDAVKDYTGIAKSNYCVHIDGTVGTVASQKYMRVEDCVFISDFHDCLGCGIRDGWTLHVKNCELRNNATDKCFAYHNTTSASTGTIILDNNRMYAQGNYAVALTDISAGASSITTVKSYNNVVYSATQGKNTSGVDGSKFVLSPDSFGNNSSQLNAV